MSHGPKSKKRKAFKVRRANALAQRDGYRGAAEAFKKSYLLADDTLFAVLDAGYNRI